LGIDHYEAVFAIYVLQSVLILAAYFLRFESDLLIVSLYLVFCLTVVGFLQLASATGWRIRNHPHGPGAPATPAWVDWLRREQRLLKGALYAAMMAVPAFLFLGALFVAAVPKDIGALALALLLVLLPLYLRYRHKPFNIMERASAYIAAICVVYLVQSRPGSLADLDLYRNVLFAAMAVAVAIGFRFGKERFRITPMDFLVIFIAVSVPNLPDLNFTTEHLGINVAMVIVLFYSIEMILNNFWRRWDVMRFTTYITLAVLGFRGVIGT
jgi:UDP-GlcNAc:undecaprenyl-phosphate GlcNAc-1-phosphate transferase